MSSRQAAVDLLRRSRLLPLAERVRLVELRLRKAKANRSFAALHRDEAMPPAWLFYDAFGGFDYDRYWRSGIEVADYLAALAERYLGAREPGHTVCDWGCGPARVVRQLASRHRDVFARVIGSDYNVASIEWCRRSIDGVEFLVNGLAPPLPMHDGQVDLLFARSVFTHLSEDRMRDWMTELCRVVRPGGVLVLTLHGDGFAHKLLPRERERYEHAGVVVRAQVKEGARAYVSFTSPRYVREVLLRSVDVLEHVTDAPEIIATGQDIWIVRVPERSETAGEHQ